MLNRHLVIVDVPGPGVGHLVGELGPDVGHEKKEHDDTRNCPNNLQGDDEIIREIHCLRQNFQSFLVFLFVEAWKLV